MRRLLPFVFLIPSPALARDALGMFGNWGAFRDAGVPRCYAIAMAEPTAKPHETQPYADVGIWPKRGIRGSLHIRLSRRVAPHAPIQLSLAGQKFALAGGGLDAWAADKRMEAAIIAAMRSAQSMSVTSRDAAGRIFTDHYPLSGAATAIDAALLACAGR